jgi:hypothetical protein
MSTASAEGDLLFVVRLAGGTEHQDAAGAPVRGVYLSVGIHRDSYWIGHPGILKGEQRMPVSREFVDEARARVRDVHHSEQVGGNRYSEVQIRRALSTRSPFPQELDARPAVCQARWGRPG